MSSRQVSYVFPKKFVFVLEIFLLPRSSWNPTKATIHINEDRRRAYPRLVIPRPSVVGELTVVSETMQVASTFPGRFLGADEWKNNVSRS